MTPITEAELQAMVVELAHLAGWMIQHTRPARTADGGWRTPIQGHKGFPDLVLVHERHGRVIFAELKSETGRVRPEQREWATALQATTGRSDVVQYRLWRPSDWDDIERTLRTGEVSP